MIWLILLISLGLRLIGINQSLWLDETISANVAKMPLKTIVSSFSISDFHPPGYYWFLNLWVKFFGSEVVVMRLSSVLFSLIVIWLVYEMGKLIKDRKTGLWAAVLVGVNPLFIYYSQELRMYAMATMFLTASVYFWLKMIKNSEEVKTGWWISFNLLTGLAFLTFYGSIFLTGAMILYLAVRRKWKLFFKSFWGLSISIILISPLLITQLKGSGQMLDQVTNWSLVLGQVNLKNLLLIPLKFSMGRVSWYPKVLYYLTGGLWAFMVLIGVFKSAIKNKKILWLLLAPLVLGIAFSFKSPMIQYFRFIYLIPILGISLAEIKSDKLKLFLTIGFIGFSGLYLLNPEMHREDWKSVAASLENGTKVYMIGSFGDPIKFYNATVLVEDIKTIEPKEDKIKVITYGEMIHGINSQDKLTKLGYQLVKKNNFREITTEEWEKKK